MEHSLVVALLAGLGGMLGWGLADFFAKKTIDVIGDTASLAWGHVFGVIALLLSLFIFSDRVVAPTSFSTSNITLFIVFGAVQAAVYLYLYKGFGKGQLALLNPIFASFSGITALLSILVLGEIVTGSIVFSLAVLFFGLILVSLDMHALKARTIRFSKIPGLREIFFATVLASVWTLFWDKFVSAQDWLLYTFIMYTIMTVVVWIVAKMQNIKLSGFPKHVWKYLVMIGLFEVIAYVAVSLGYSATTHTSVVAVVSGAFSLPTIILARIFLREQTTKVQAVGSVVIIAGIVLLSLL